MGAAIQAHADAAAKINKAKDAAIAAMDRVLRGMRAKAKEQIALMRAEGISVPTAAVKASLLKIDDYGYGVAKKIREDAKAFYTQFGVNSANVYRIGDIRPRAFCQKNETWQGDLVNMGDSAGDRATLFHEFGHSMEWQVYANEATTTWLKRRATGPTQKLNDLLGDARYRDDEIAYPGPWYDPYVGKDYGGSTTEVVATGLEKFTDGRNLLDLWLRDREHFQLILGLLPL
jgi:hypothetical protein